MHLFRNTGRSQTTSKCGKNEKVADWDEPTESLMFLPHFEFLHDLFLSCRPMATWNVFVFYNKKSKKVVEII